MRMRNWVGIILLLVSATAWAKREAPLAALTTQPGFLDVQADAAEARVIVGVHALDAPMLMVTALPAALGSNDIGLDRNQSGESKLVEFRRLGRKLLLVQRNMKFVANSGDADETMAARDAFAEAVLWSGDLLNPEDAQKERQTLAPYAQFSAEGRGRIHKEAPPELRTHISGIATG